jgi:hypothetical protein
LTGAFDRFLLFFDKDYQMHQENNLTRFACRAAEIAKWLNYLYGFAICLALVLSIVLEAPLKGLLQETRPDAELETLILGLRIEMVIGISAAIATGWLLVALSKILHRAAAGDPFNAASAGHVRTMAWALLALQVLDIPASALGYIFNDLGTAAPAVSISLGGWMAVLVLFVLSHVFATGHIMRDDLDGTV